MDELNTLLGEAVMKEDYEKASRIRDEINNRSE
ncbi:MAG: UvrB/UvrC motif-containing protein [Perlabentimonas sp.]